MMRRNQRQHHVRANNPYGPFGKPLAQRANDNLRMRQEAIHVRLMANCSAITKASGVSF